ncbi:unnamed protein product, partial [Lymnaea stagnalis]
MNSAESHCKSWSNGALKTPASSSSPSHHLPSSTHRKNLSEPEDLEDIPTAVASTTARNCDRPDSSPSPQSQLNSSFEESENTRADTNMQTSDRFGQNTMNLDASYERRSRRKPTNEDIRRVRQLQYDSEESEIEDDILNEEIMMMKKLRESENDEVDGTGKSEARISSEPRYKVDDENHFSADRLSRHEAVDGIPEDDD